MNKISKNIIVFGLVILGFVLLSTPASAETVITGGDPMAGTPPIPSISYVSQNAGDSEGMINILVEGSNFTPNASVRFNGNGVRTYYIDDSNLIVKISNTDFPDNHTVLVSVVNVASIFNGGSKYSNAKKININNSAARGANNTASNNENNNNGGNGNVNSENGQNSTENASGNETTSSLASSAIFGGNSLVPSGLIQWVLFAIIILLIIIIVRKVTGASDRYHKSPLKHA